MPRSNTGWRSAARADAVPSSVVPGAPADARRRPARARPAGRPGGVRGDPRAAGPRADAGHGRRRDARRARPGVAGADRAPASVRAAIMAPATIRPWRTNPATRSPTTQQAGDAAGRRVATRCGAGWTVLARNVHVGRHELDLVAVDRVLRRRSSWSRCAGGAVATSVCPRRPSTTANGRGSGPRHTACSTAGRCRAAAAALAAAVRPRRRRARRTGSPPPPRHVTRRRVPPPTRATLPPGPGHDPSHHDRRPRHKAWSTHADRSDRDGAGRPSPGPGDEVRGGKNRQEVATVPSVSMRQLLEAGVHFGHQTRAGTPR